MKNISIRVAETKKKFMSVNLEKKHPKSAIVTFLTFLALTPTGPMLVIIVAEESISLLLAAN